MIQINHSIPFGTGSKEKKGPNVAIQTVLTTDQSFSSVEKKGVGDKRE